jgi:phospholipase C
MRATGSWRVAVLAMLCGAAAVAVAWPDRSPVAPARPAAARPVVLVAGSPRSPIKHIVFVAKENRSFDHYFGRFPDPTHSLKQSLTSRCWQSDGTVRSFRMPQAPEPMPQDVSHSHGTWTTAYHGGAMDGFCHEGGAIVAATGRDLADTQMRAGTIPNYWAYASNYGIGDNMFASWRGASFGNNVFAVAAQTGRFDTTLGRRAILGNPVGGDAAKGAHTWGCDNSAGTTVPMIDLHGAMSNVFPCFTFKALPNIMDAAGVSWRYYGQASHWIHSGIAAIDSIRCAPGDTPPCEQPNPYWDAHIKTESDIITDAARNTLPDVSWYLPAASEHPPLTACAGENATVKAVNAIMKSPAGASTAIVVWWDEWGGFYDHVKPPTAVGTDDGITGLNTIISYGFRVPLLVISPWTKRGPLGQGGYASHTFYSHASFARFVEWAFNLPTLDAADDLRHYTADEPKPGNLTDFFDFASTPKGKLPLTIRTCPRLTAAEQQVVRTSDPD